MIVLRRALADIRNNRLMHSVAIITIALSVLTVTAFLIFFVNVNDLLAQWKKGLRIIAYIDAPDAGFQPAALIDKLGALKGVSQVVYISRTTALENLKKEMHRQRGVFEFLGDNPLPDAFEIHLDPGLTDWRAIEALAQSIEKIAPISDVEYGRLWIGRLTGIISLFRLSGFFLGALFFTAAIFIVANTIRLVVYTKIDEIEIMRLVGATDGFILAPLYLEGLIEGAIGGIIGLAILAIGHFAILTRIQPQGLFELGITIHFLSPGYCLGIFLLSVLVGWIGCFLSVKQFITI